MIGVFDSGIGGLTLLHEIMQQLPNEQYCYYADTENVPYSTKTEEQIKNFVEKAVNYLLEKGVKVIVLACNTATNVCVEDLRSRLSIPIIAIQPAVKVAVEHNKAFFPDLQKKILVCATPITLRSARFDKLVNSLNANSIIERMALPELVKLAERQSNGIFDHEAYQYISESLKQIELDKFGSFVLGCTHFTYFEPIFREFSPKIAIFDGNEGTARHTKNILEKLSLISNKGFSIEYVESGKISSNTTRFENYLERIKHLN